NAHIEVPVSLVCVQAVVGDDEQGINRTVGAVMARAERERVIGVEIQIEIGLEVGAADASQGKPAVARLYIQTAAQESPCGHLQRWLELDGASEVDGAVDTRAPLSPERAVGVRTEPRVRVVVLPAQVEILA